MSNNESISTNPEQKLNPVERRIGGKIVRGTPAEAPTPRGPNTNLSFSQAEAAYQAHLEKAVDPNIMPFDTMLTSSQESINPIDIPLNPDLAPAESIIRRPYHHENFTITGNPLVIGCWADELPNMDGHYVGDSVFPMDNVMRDDLKLPTLALALHPCITLQGDPLIFPELLERRCTEKQSLHTSLEEAVKAASKSWINLWYDEEEERFHHRRTPVSREETIDYPGFLWDCLDALGRSFYCERKHPLQALIRDQQRLHAARQ